MADFAKRILTLGMVALLLGMGLLAGCGKKGSGESSNAPTAEEASAKAKEMLQKAKAGQ